MRATVVVRLRRWRARYRRCVVLLAIAVVVGLAIGLTRPPLGPTPFGRASSRSRSSPSEPCLNAPSALLDGSAATLCLALSLAVLIAVAMANRHITGVAVVGFGLLLNLVAVARERGRAGAGQRPRRGGGDRRRRGRHGRAHRPPAPRDGDRTRSRCSATCSPSRSPTRSCRSAT